MGSSSSKAARDPWAACQAGALGPLTQWLDSGGSPDAVDSTEGRGSLLHVAAAAGQPACIKLLAQRGANINLGVEGVGTPLHAAAACGASTTALMLDYGASPDARFRGRTAAEVAEANGFPDTASLIRLHMMEHQQGSLESGGGGADVPAPPATVDSGAAGLDVSGSSDAALDDPLLSFVRSVMLKRPPPEQQPSEPVSGSEPRPIQKRIPVAQAAAEAAPQAADRFAPRWLRPQLMAVAAHAAAPLGTAPQAAAGAGPAARKAAAAPVAQQAAAGAAAQVAGAKGEAAAAPSVSPPGPLDDWGSELSTSPPFPTSAGIDIRLWEVPFEDLKLERIVGRGSESEVYQARFHETVVAVRVLKPDSDPRLILHDFCKECRTLVSLRHPNVVQCMGVCTAPPAIVAEYCSRGSLHDVLSGAKESPDELAQLSWPRRLSLALDAAKGMLYLHKRGIVHARLKSLNLLVDGAWRCKVADICIHAIMSRGTDDYSVSLNPFFLSPEEVDIEEPTRASDVFKWGNVMFELLTLTMPWLGGGPFSVAAKLLSGERPEVPPLDQLPGTDTRTFAGLEGYIALMRRCWAQQPSERPGFEEVVPELRRLVGMCREQPGPAVPQLSAALHAPIGGGSGRAAGEGEAPPGGAGTSGMPGTEVPPSLGAADAARRAKMLAQQQLRGAKLDSPDEPSWSLWMAPDRPMLMPLPQAQDSEQGHAAASPAGDGGRPAVPAGSGTGTGVGAPAGSAPASPAPGSAQLPGSGAAQGSAVQQQGSRPLGAAGGSSSPQPGSPQPSGPPTPGRRPRQGPSSPTLLQALCCCSSAVIPAPSREAVHFAVDFRAWSVNFEDLHMQQFIGKGSYGKVYRAKLHETLVAVKVLLDYEEARQAAERNALHTITDPIAASLQQECGLMATLRHPNIVQFMGVSTCPPAMVTEFCSRGSLASVLRASKQAPLSWPRRLSVALDAAKGMLYLHMRGIVHRDLKSPNLLVDATWRCKVADFNLSKILEKGGAGAEGQLVRSSLCCWSSGSSGRKGASPPSSAGSGCPTPSPLASGSGTLGNVNPRWLAPEVLNGEVATYASDVFSWGVVMWELLTLERPWENVADWPLYTRLRNGQRLEVPPCDKLPGADTRTFAGLQGYIALMQRCWAEQPDQRPGFEEVIHELRRLMEAAVPRAAGG